MNLNNEKHTILDIVKITSKISPIYFGLFLLISILNTLVPTSVLALANSSFVNTAILIFNGDLLANEIFKPLLILIFILFVVNVLSSLPDLLSEKIELDIESKLSPKILEKQSKLDYKYIENSESIELIEMVSEDSIYFFIDTIKAITTYISAILGIVSVAFLIFTQVWWSGILMLVFSIPIFFIAYRSGIKSYEARVEANEFERRYSYYSDEVLTNKEAVEERSLFDYTEDLTKIYHNHFKEASSIQLKVGFKNKMKMKATNIVLLIAIFFIILSLIEPFINGHISPGVLVGIVSALLSLSEIISSQLQESTKNLAEAKEFMDDFTEFINLDSVEGSNGLPDPTPLEFKTLEFVNVSFRYPNSDEYIFKSISFKIEAGKSYAFVGKNGAGKTSITKLMIGLYSDYTGKILINGKDLRNYQQSTIKSLFSVVFQDFSRYQISLADNISLSRPYGATIDEIKDISNKAGLSKLIESLPNGIDSKLGKIYSQAIDLSGGEWQKIAFSRAALSFAPIKILDEPTSSLDPLAENRIYKEFESLMEGSTSILISHRLGITKLADKIFVLDDGRIVEEGSHYDLINKNGLYSIMYEEQKKWYE